MDVVERQAREWAAVPYHHADNCPAYWEDNADNCDCSIRDLIDILNQGDK